MRALLVAQASLLLLLLLYDKVEAALLGLRGGGTSSSTTRQEEGDSDKDRGRSSSSSANNNNKGRDQTTTKAYRLPGQHTRRERRCESSEQEVCGQGLGYLICEYNDMKHTFATRCVRQPKTSLHLQLHPHNYCGTCRRCFEDSNELRHAVASYITNSTQHTQVAANYGWPINKWCVSKIKDFSNLFANHRKFRDNIGDWDVSQALNMSGMFQAAFVFNQDLSQWKTDNVQDMSRMFDSAYEFNQPVQSWNTERVTSMSRMFRVAKKFDQDLSGWQTRRLRDISHMFYRAHNFNQPLRWDDTSNIHDMSFAFAFTRRFNDSSIVQWDVSRVQTLRGTFQNTGAFDQDLSSWDIARVSDMSFMFYKALAFQKDDEKQRAILEKWDLSSKNLLEMQNMFTFGGASWPGMINSTVTSRRQLEGVTLLTHPSYEGTSMNVDAVADKNPATTVGATNNNGVTRSSESTRGGRGGAEQPDIL